FEGKLSRFFRIYSIVLPLNLYIFYKYSAFIFSAQGLDRQKTLLQIPGVAAVGVAGAAIEPPPRVAALPGGAQHQFGPAPGAAARQAPGLCLLPLDAADLPHMGPLLAPGGPGIGLQPGVQCPALPPAEGPPPCLPPDPGQLFQPADRDLLAVPGHIFQLAPAG